MNLQFANRLFSNLLWQVLQHYFVVKTSFTHPSNQYIFHGNTVNIYQVFAKGRRESHQNTKFSIVNQPNSIYKQRGRAASMICEPTRFKRHNVLDYLISKRFTSWMILTRKPCHHKLMINTILYDKNIETVILGVPLGGVHGLKIEPCPHVWEYMGDANCSPLHCVAIGTSKWRIGLNFFSFDLLVSKNDAI